MTAAVLLVQMLASLHDPRSGDMLDRGLVLRFPGPASFTGTAHLTDLWSHCGEPATEQAVLVTWTLRMHVIFPRSITTVEQNLHVSEKGSSGMEHS